MKLRITLEGKVYEVDVEILEDGSGAASSAPAPVYTPSAPVAAPPRPAPVPVKAPAAAPATAGAAVYPSPIAGTVRAINVKVGDTVANNQEMLVLEAMKMETSVSSSRDGKIKAILVNIGDSVQAGQGLIEYE